MFTLSGQPSLPKPPEMEEYFADSKISSFPASASRMTTPSPSPSILERRIERFLSASFSTCTPLSSRSLTPKPSTLNENFIDTSSETTCPRSKSLHDSSDNFQLSVRMKLDAIIENQQKQLALLRKVLVNTHDPDTEYTEEILATPCDSVEELEDLCQRLEENPYLCKMIYYLSSLGWYNIGDSVRRMMKKVGTQRLWSEYSLKGEACLKNIGKAKANEIEEAISETLIYAPNYRGGIKYKVPEQRKKQINFIVEEEILIS